MTREDIYKKYEQRIDEIFDYFGNELKPLGGQCQKCLQQKVNCTCSKFKIGDWVRLKRLGGLQRLTCSTINSKQHLEEAELWEPKVGEWCWYGFELIEVIDTTNPLKICRQQSDSYEEVSGTMLEPFIGNLPSFIKDK